MASTDTQTLSARETEVLAALGEHRTNAAIARQLHISVRTVESHVSSLLRKLGAADRHELAERAERAAAAGPPLDHPWGVAGLPERWTSFVGRQAQITEIRDAVRDSRLVTLLGPGGVGKTTLATVVAEQLIGEFPAGGAFVDLVPVSDEFVVQAVAAALGVIERPQEPLDELVLERLRDGHRLLVFDNCEHVLGAVGAFVRQVLAACREVVIVTTSRERLGVTGERIVTIPPMALADPADDGTGSEAVALFLARAAGDQLDDVEPSQEATQIAEICRRLDGMPLAIELAAARSNALGVDGLLAGLDDHLRLLGRANGPTDRHGSLRAVIDWSHDLLDDEERRLFRRLGVFVGAFDLASVTAVAADGDDAAAIDLIGRLTDKSLLAHRRETAGSRWRMLDTVRAYAREQLDASGERAEVQGRHLVWAASVALRLESELDGGEAWRSELDVVADDLRSALTTSATPAPGAEHPGVDFELALALGHLTYARRFLVEARSHYETAVERAPTDAEAALALRVWADAAMAEMRGAIGFDLQLAAAERARRAGDAATAAIALADAASIGARCPATFVVPPTHEALVEMVTETRALAPADDRRVAAHVVAAAAWNGRPGPTETDPALADEALVLATELDDPVLISGALDAVAAAANAEGRHRDASRLSAERLTLLDRMPRHDPRVGGEIADIFHMATESALAAGQLERAMAAARLASDDSIGQGLDHFAATHLVLPLALQGDFDEALAQAEVMNDGWERTGRPAAGWMAPAFFAAALASGVRGDAEQNRRWFELGGLLCTQVRTNSFSLYVEPRVALHLGDLDRAARGTMGEDEDVAGLHVAYARGVAVEVAVVAGADDAHALLDAARPKRDENEFVDAMLDRAEGRLLGDDALLERAVTKWEAIGARFERACTLSLLPRAGPKPRRSSPRWGARHRRSEALGRRPRRGSDGPLPGTPVRYHVAWPIRRASWRARLMRRILGSNLGRIGLVAGLALLATACLPTFGGGQILSAKAGTGSNVRLVWNSAYDSDAGDSISYYELSVNGTVVDTVLAPASNCTMSGLASGTHYDFAVTAYSSHLGSPEWSGAVGGPVAYLGRLTTSFTTPAGAIAAGTFACTNGDTDTDHDRLPDWAETNTGVFASLASTGTSPTNADTDGDGIKDGDEALGTLAGLDLPGMGASPVHKDLAMEFDWFDDSDDPGSAQPTATVRRRPSSRGSRRPTPTLRCRTPTASTACTSSPTTARVACSPAATSSPMPTASSPAAWTAPTSTPSRRPTSAPPARASSTTC